ncbi:hypothetical protein EYF80_021246 [Liparis tanakae]|uniref:Uncharacterized protein n=1 Tax=Liparis tanakae TaxID=230148 RepID=A0A4Z2HSH8_9TELE|nr:hypothetical protein EYF80_021246 [Liparis tanakae]
MKLLPSGVSSPHPDEWPRYLGFVEMPQFLLVFTVVCVLTLVAAQELLDLLPVLALQLLQRRPLLLLELGLGLAECAQLLLEGPPHLLHLPRHGHHPLRVLPKEEVTEETELMICSSMDSSRDWIRLFRSISSLILLLYCWVNNGSNRNGLKQLKHSADGLQPDTGATEAKMDPNSGLLGESPHLFRPYATSSARPPSV